MCYVEVCSISVDFTLILLLRTSKYSKGWIKFESERKIKCIEEKQFRRLMVERLRYGRYSSLAEAGYEVFTDANVLLKLLLRKLSGG